MPRRRLTGGKAPSSAGARSLALLQLVAAEGRPIALADLASGLGLPKATTHRLCEQLVAGDFLTRDAGEDVAAGPYAINQGSLALSSNYSLDYIGADLVITPRALTLFALGVNKVYDGTTAATVIWSDDRIAGDHDGTIGLIPRLLRELAHRQRRGVPACIGNEGWRSARERRCQHEAAGARDQATTKKVHAASLRCGQPC